MLPSGLTASSPAKSTSTTPLPTAATTQTTATAPPAAAPPRARRTSSGQQATAARSASAGSQPHRRHDSTVASNIPGRRRPRAPRRRRCRSVPPGGRADGGRRQQNVRRPSPSAAGPGATPRVRTARGSSNGAPQCGRQQARSPALTRGLRHRVSAGHGRRSGPRRSDTADSGGEQQERPRPARTRPGRRPQGRGVRQLPARVRARRSALARRSLPLAAGSGVAAADLLSCLRRGAAAGAAGGALAGVFGLVLAEPVMDWAVRLEGRVRRPRPPHSTPPVKSSRSTSRCSAAAPSTRGSWSPQW